MAMKAGFKQTDAGTIPNDWIVLPLQSLTPPNGRNSIVDGPFGSNLKTIHYRKSGIPIVTSGHVTNGKFKADEYLYVDRSKFNEEKRSAVRPGDIVMAKIGERCGASAILPETHETGILSGNALKISVDSTRHSVHYIWQVLWKSYSSGNMELLRTVGAQPALSMASLKKYVLALPPTKAEQEAIAQALTDADALIEALGQLIAKKRNIKQGAMQELLRPRSSDQVRPLREVSSLKGRIGWQGLKQEEFTTNEDEPFLITGMNFKDGAIRWKEVYHVSDFRYEIAKDIQLRTGDVLMTKDGTIGKTLYIDTIPYPSKATLNSHLLLFRPIRGTYSPKYLYYQLSSQRFKDFIELSKSGTTFFGISQAATGKYPVLLPMIEEQVRIATILSDIDEEIDLLETKLDKIRHVKQGMTQELLTGRIRLV